MSELREINLEHGMPTVQTALSQLALELRRTRSMGCTGLKIIHGYGSSGKGGKIRVQARSRLARMKGAGEIRAFRRCGALRKDPDLERHNNGVTIILL